MNKKAIITSILLIVLCLSLISGSTYALFTSESKINIAVTSGKVDVRANISIFAIYSAEADPNGSLLDEHNNKYSHVKQTGVDENGKYLFANNGKAYLNMQGVLNLERMSPGDKVSVVLSVANSSDISAKYRLKFEVSEGGEELASILVTTIGTTSYTGLSRYRSPWQDIQIGQNPYYNFTIEMPMNAGNEYQGLASNMVITVEAVQGNASTDDELLVETFAKQTSSKTVTLVNGNATVNTSISPSEEKHATTVVFNNVGINGQAALGVSTSGLVANIDKSFVVSETTVNNVVGTISFDLSQNETPVTTFTSGYAKVSTYITKGLSNVGVIYTGVDTYKFGKNNPGVRKDSEEQVQSPGDYYYNPVTGLLVFITDHFSEFLITSDDAKVYVPELCKVFTSLSDAITACEEGYTVILLKDITLLKDTADDRLILAKAVKIKGKSISFDKSDDSVPLSKPIMTSVQLPKMVTYEDITFNGKAGDLTFGTQNSNVVLNNVTINADSNIGFLHSCQGTVTLNNVTIANTGYNSGATLTAKEAAIAAELGGNIVINGGTYSSEHGYAVYVFSSGGTVTINDGKFDGKICANIDRTTYGDKESRIIINGGEFTNADFSVLYQQEEIDKGHVSIEIKGGKFDVNPTAYVDTTNYDVTNQGSIWVVTLKNQVNP